MCGSFRVALARGIAIGAHAGQVDKSGQPYIGHPERVANRVTGTDRKVLAWLHDVVEDTAVTLDDLFEAGFTRSIIVQVDALTHRKHEPRETYYSRLLPFPDAVAVKLADIEDNSDPARLAALPVEDQERLIRKYAKARAFLSGVIL